MKSTWYKVYNYSIKNKCSKKKLRRSDIDNGDFQQRISQQLQNGYKHMNSRNDRWIMRLKSIEAEYYSIGI